MSDSNTGKPGPLLSPLLFLARSGVIAISVVMIVVALLQVLFRYVLATPLSWSEELARYCFVWIVFLGAAIGLQRGFHLGVDLLVNTFPKPIRNGLEIMCFVLIGGFAVTVAYASLSVLEMNTMQRSPAMGVQMSWIYVAIPISMVLIFFISLARIAQRVRHGFRSTD